jgi:hypothetical protein
MLAFSNFLFRRKCFPEKHLRSVARRKSDVTLRGCDIVIFCIFLPAATEINQNGAGKAIAALVESGGETKIAIHGISR